MTCTELEELLGAYVLDAVTPEEREAVEAHITQCPRCPQLVQEMRAAVDLIPINLPQVDPAPHLKGRVLAAVQATADASSQATQNVASVRPIRAVPPRMPEPQTPTVPIPLVARRRSVAQRWAMPLVAAAAMFFLVLSGGLATWGISLQHQVASLQANTVSTTTYAIKGTSNAPGVTGEAKHITGNGVDVTVMTLRGLPALQDQQVYQGWELQGKESKSVGLLTAQPDGTATISIPGDVKGNDAIAVSLEKGPSPTPNAPKGKVLAEGRIV